MSTLGPITSQIGLLSGLNYGSIVDQLIAISRRPADQIQLRVDNQTITRNLLERFSLKLIGLKLSASSFGVTSSSTSTERTAVSSSTDIIATARSNAALGSFPFTPVSVLSPNIFASDQIFAFTTDIINTGGRADFLEIQAGANPQVAIYIDETVDTVQDVIDKINIGQNVLRVSNVIRQDPTDDYNPGSAGTLEISVGGAPPVSVAITAGNSVNQIRNAINGTPGVGVTAFVRRLPGNPDFALGIASNTLGAAGAVTITQTGGAGPYVFIEEAPAVAPGDVTASTLSIGANQLRLLITSNTSGTAGALTLTTANRITQGGDLTNLSFDDPGAEISPATDAVIFSGGAPLTNTTSNLFTDIMPGLDLEVIIGSGNPLIVTVTDTTTSSGSDNDADLLVAANDFVDAFNDVKRFINQNSAFNLLDDDTGRTGSLFQSITVETAEGQLNRFVTTSFFQTRSLQSGNPLTMIESLPELGFDLDDQGLLSLDESRFQNALDADRDDVDQFLNGTVTRYAVNPFTGAVDSSTDQIGFVAEFNELVDSLTNSVGLVTGRIDTIERQITFDTDRMNSLLDHLEVRRAQLLLEFTSFESSLANLQSQSGALLQLQTLAIRTTLGSGNFFS